jgi:hypothetical protein
MCGLIGLALSVSTAQAVSINPVPCKASTITSTETFEFPEIKEFFKKASENAAKVPWIKTFSVTIGAAVASTKGEKCCPGAQYPSTYHEIGGGVSGSATLEVLAPPPLATAGGVNISANTPAIEWLGIPPVQLFSLTGRWQLGLYATASGTLGMDLTGHISECGNCVTLAVKGKLTIGIGATANGTLNFTIGSSTIADIVIGADISATTSIAATGDGKIGTGSECKTKLCGKVEAGDVTLAGKIYATIPTWGSWSIEWSGFHVEPTALWEGCIPE